jgi:hypothetical protein
MSACGQLPLSRSRTRRSAAKCSGKDRAIVFDVSMQSVAPSDTQLELL